MYELEKTTKVNQLIAITKSNSGVSGPCLAKAHVELGQIMGEQLAKEFDPEETTIVALLRGGLFFAEGMYFKMGCKFQTYDPKNEVFLKPSTKHIILVDSVINTGKTIKKIIEDDMHVACCVINEKAVAEFNERLFTVRVSRNSFVGEHVLKQEGGIGPDTTLRLFNQI